MPDDTINQLGTAEELRQINTWLNAYNLSDAEIYPLIEAIGETIWGDISLDEFWEKLKKAVPRDLDTQRKIAVSVAKRRFMDFKDDIGDVDAFISKMGGIELQVEQIHKSNNLSVEEIDQKLSKYDWSKIVGIERRALLEELGVSLKDLVKWLGEKK